MGVVYQAFDEALQRKAALKVLHWRVPGPPGENPLDWLLAEARHVARIRHPHVIRVYAVARHAGVAFIAMELVDGPSAEELVRRRGPLETRFALRLLADVASALHAAHEQGIIHRDVKPANILVEANGAPQLGDFGMAFSEKHGAAGRSTAVGTPHYLAPEQWQNTPATAQTDIFSLGATFFHLTSGRPPFEGETVNEVRQHCLLRPAPSLWGLRPELPEGVEALARSMLERDPARRPPSCLEIEKRARQLLAPSSARPHALDTSPVDAPPSPAPVTKSTESPETSRMSETLDPIEEITGYTTSDRAGMLLEAKGESDPEAVAGVAGFAAASLDEAGHTLGLGAAKSLWIRGPKGAHLMWMRPDRVSMLALDPSASMTDIESKVQSALGDREGSR